jgi:hypothetical protein
VAHVAVGVKRLDVCGGRRIEAIGCRRAGELIDRLRQPQLEGLGPDRLAAVEHQPKAGIGIGQFAAGLLEPAERDREHDVVEVGAAHQPLARRRVVSELRAIRIRGPAPPVADPRDRVICVCAGGGDCQPVQLDRVDDGPPGHQPQIRDFGEEVKPHPPPPEREVQGRKHHVAHPGSHAPHERAFVVDHHQQ